MASAPMAQPTRPRTGLYELQRFAYRYLGPGLRYIVLIALALLFLFPFYLMIRTAVITQPEVASFDWVWWPQEMHWRENLEGIFNDQTAPMSIGLRNSAIIAGVQTRYNLFPRDLLPCDGRDRLGGMNAFSGLWQDG